jgi:galactose mutarotase-like enzyme
MDPVAGAPFDFRTMRAIDKDIPQRGYDNNFVLRPHRADKVVAEVDDPKSGRTLKVCITQPGGSVLRATLSGAGSRRRGRHPPALSTFCLETLHFPDSAVPVCGPASPQAIPFHHFLRLWVRGAGTQIVLALTGYFARKG